MKAMKAAIKTHARLMAPIEEGYRISEEMSALIDHGEFAVVEFPQDESEKVLNLVAEAFGITASDLQDAIIEYDQNEEDKFMDSRVWIDPAGGMHYGNEADPAAMYR